MDYGSEAAIVAEFHKFVVSGQLYRGSKPVMWSPVERTALADAEVEYHDHNSPPVWVKFPVVEGPQAVDGDTVQDGTVRVLQRGWRACPRRRRPERVPPSATAHLRLRYNEVL